jgi:hypothetical protein
MVETKQVVIKLTSWQKRQLVNYLPSQKIAGLDPRRLRFIAVLPGKGGCLASYKVVGRINDGFEIFLTDTQIKAVKAVLGAGAEVVAVTISAEAIRQGAVVLNR